MRAALHQRHNLLEFFKVSFLLRRKKAKPFKERNHVFYDGVKVGNLVIPNAVWSASESSAAQVSLEKSENHSIFLRYIKADRDFPRNRIITAWSKGNVKASFAVRESRKVISNFRGHPAN